MSRSVPSTAEQMCKSGSASLNGEGNGTKKPPSEKSPYGFDSLRYRQEISAMSWNRYLPTASDDAERIKQIEHCFSVFVTGEYSTELVEADPSQVRVVSHRKGEEGACEVYNAEQLFTALERVGSSQEVREILVNGGLEL